MTSRDEGPWRRVGELAERARRGDETAFRTLLEEHRSAVVSTLLACGVRNAETARDLAQDVALKAWTRLPRLRDPRSFPAWIRRIAANAARDHLRRLAVRREESLEAALTLDTDEGPHERSERLSELRLMLVALDAEDDETTELLVARADGQPVAALAGRLGISEGALKMRLLRVRRRLRQRLDELRRGGTGGS